MEKVSFKGKTFRRIIAFLGCTGVCRHVQDGINVDHLTFQTSSHPGSMNSLLRMRQYQQQAVRSASPEQLILKLYDHGIASCRRNDRVKVRAVLVELVSSLDFEQGGDIANRLSSLYEYCLAESATGDLIAIEEVLCGLREAWKQGVMARKAA